MLSAQFRIFVLELFVIKKKVPVIGLEDTYKKILIEIIEKHLPNAAIYLYGSRACGNAQECSDVDIALDTGEIIDREIIYKIMDDLEESKIPFFVDITDVNNISEKFKSGIEKEWVVWKKK